MRRLNSNEKVIWSSAFVIAVVLIGLLIRAFS
jgi:hypothetical protein